MSYVVNCSIYEVAKNELRSKLLECLSEALTELKAKQITYG